MFNPLGLLLPSALDRLKVRRPVEAVTVCQAADEVLGSLWDHAVPMRAVSYREGRLRVAVTSAAWAHEISSQGEEVKERTNAQLGGQAVRQVQVQVSPTAARGE